MSTEVVMPQMGESIAEGTIVKWYRRVGDRIEKDENLFEISTDKVDAEIPSPASGVLEQILVEEGKTVPVGTVVAVIGTGAASRPAEPAAEPPHRLAGSPPQPAARPVGPAPEPSEVRAAARQAESQPAPVGAAVAIRDDLPRTEAGREGTIPSREELRRTRSSPVVRRIAREHGLDFTRLQGTGISGRVTKKDILAYLEAQPRPAPVPPRPAEEPAGLAALLEGELEPWSPMRRKIAEHMVTSRDTSVHVSTVWEVDMTRVHRLREKHKKTEPGLTYLAFILKATVDTLRRHPRLNASVEGEATRLYRHVNLGVAVALDWGLVVPVIHRAEEKSLLGLARSLADLAERARAKKLAVEEVKGGTFTVTNPGVFGSLFGTPIINQPQVAILGVGAIQRRVVALDDDTFGIRRMMYLALSFDHRVIDGADADRFMADLRHYLENFPEEGL
ncbi:MAG TPA: dihydrolipoamide acetyltransferase family protein [Candidatus Nitrosotenuis sp.]|nr:dihydrolipoamide acetyltransferase family protein [Candidatus Nitrosotenuis sp.]